MYKDRYVTMMFNLEFNKTEFTSKAEAEKYIAKASEWWNENHLEDTEDYEFRIKHILRPCIEFIIKQ